MGYVVKSPLHMALWEGGGEIEFDAIISFRVTPGSPASFEQPAEAPEVEVTRFQIARCGGVIAECPDWLLARFEADDSFSGWLISEAAEQNQYDRECAAEARAEEREVAEMERHFQEHPHG